MGGSVDFSSNANEQLLKDFEHWVGRIWFIDFGGGSKYLNLERLIFLYYLNDFFS